MFIKDRLLPVIKEILGDRQCTIQYLKNAPNSFDEVLQVRPVNTKAANLDICADIGGGIFVSVGQTTTLEYELNDFDKDAEWNNLIKTIAAVINGKFTEQVWWWKDKSVKYQSTVLIDGKIERYYDTNLPAFILSMGRQRVQTSQYEAY